MNTETQRHRVFYYLLSHQSLCLCVSVFYFVPSYFLIITNMQNSGVRRYGERRFEGSGVRRYEDRLFAENWVCKLFRPDTVKDAESVTSQ